MELVEYHTALNKVLFQHSVSARQNILKILQHLPSLARSLELGVHPDQDGEGVFSINASFDGPDLLTLNKAIRDHATIFEVKHTKNGLTPPVPLLDPDCVKFIVQDVIFECAKKWLASIWEELNVSPAIPVSIINYDEFSDASPFFLHK